MGADIWYFPLRQGPMSLDSSRPPRPRINERMETSVRSARSHPILSRWHSAFVKGVAPWLAALAFISPGASAGSSYPFVPEAFNVPPVLEADTFRLRMLTVNDVIKDYDAEVFLWTRPPEQVSNINQAMLKETLTQWLAKEWPFNAPAFPGIEIPWTDWALIAESKR